MIGKAVAFVMVILAYAQLENAEKLEFRFGIIVTTLFFFFVGSPLIHIVSMITVLFHEFYLYLFNEIKIARQRK